MKKKVAILFIIIISCLKGNSQLWAPLYKEALDLYSQRKYNEAIPVIEKTINAAVNEFGESHESYLRTVNLAAYIYFNSYQYIQAEVYFLKVASIQRNLKGATSIEYGKAIQAIGSFYKQSKDFAKAERYLLEAKSVISSVVNDGHIDYLSLLMQLGNLYIQMQKYREADPIIKEVLGKSLQTLGETHQLTMNAAVALGYLYYHQGQYENAEPVFLWVIELARKNKKESEKFFGEALMGLSAAYSVIGQPSKAEALLMEILSIRKQQFGELSREYASALSQLSSLYMKMSRYKDAEKTLSKTIDVQRKLPLVPHYDYISTLNDIAYLYSKTGKLKESLTFLQKAQEHIRKVYGEKHSLYTTNLAGQALILGELKDFPQAITLAEMAMKLRQENGEPITVFILSLIQIGDLYKAQGKLKEAISYHHQAADLQKENLSETHPHYLSTLGRLAEDYEMDGQYSEASEVMISRNKMITRNLITTFSVLSEAEKEKYMANNTSVLEFSNSFALNHQGSSQFLKTNYLLLRILKAVSLSDTRRMISTVRENGNPEVTKLLAQWDSVKVRLAFLYSQPGQKQKIEISSLVKQAEQLEKRLNLLSSKLKDKFSVYNDDIPDIQERMKPREASIEFVRFRLFNKGWTDSVMYAAYILTKERSPVFIPLVEERQLLNFLRPAGGASAIKSLYRSEVTDEDGIQTTPGDSLYALIWKPLLPYLKNVTVVNYAPAGLLHRIAFHALPTGPDRLLIDDVELRRYLNTSDKSDDKSQASLSAALFGDCSFTTDNNPNQSKTYPGGKTNSLTTAALARGGNKTAWLQLPGTAEEVKNINNLFVSNRKDVQVYLKQEASEEQFKYLSGKSPTVIHLATHGYFLPDPATKLKEAILPDSTNAFTIADDPLFRSGVILTGANTTWSGGSVPAGKEDGVLTAFEIAQLDLRNTDLVALSACETALGDIKGNEGVFGLQRAFKLAGVKNMLLSLWKVPDAETAELMKLFYSNYLSGKTAAISLRNAQREMRKKYKPYFWAAFILIE